MLNFDEWTAVREKCLIIAEAGVNHNGELELARRLIDVAAESGCDAVKFQSFQTEEVLTRKAKKAEYQKNLAGRDETQFDMIKRLELQSHDFISLNDYARQKGILFVSSPCDLPSLKLLADLKVPFFKVGSAEITNTPFLREISRIGKTTILSTGMATMKEIGRALHYMSYLPPEKILLLHCVSNYPVDYEDANVMAMIELKNTFPHDVGYSDHTRGIDASLAAVSLGAKVIEKHFTINKLLPGPDHSASLVPEELKSMVQSIRNIEKCLGNGRKRVMRCELKNKDIVRRSLVAAYNMNSGHTLTRGDIKFKRPGTGILPYDLEKVLGRKLKISVSKDTLLSMDDLEGV